MTVSGDEGEKHGREAPDRANRDSVRAAILKVMEVTAGIFLPGDCSIEFVEGAL